MVFRKEYKWLSNFAPCKINISGNTYNSVEQAYQSEKNENKTWKIFCKTNTPKLVKNKSKDIALVPYWDEYRNVVMYYCLLQKFENQLYKQKLINTGNINIVEENWWNDIYWGVDIKTGKGENILGKMVMDIREYLVGV